MKAIRALCLSAFLLGCQDRSVVPAPPVIDSPTIPPAEDSELLDCRARIQSLRNEPLLPGVPELESRRAEILGRARGEPLSWLREPKLTSDAELSPAALETRRALGNAPPFRRVKSTRERHKADKSTLRALLLREGYLFSSDPVEAHALISLLDLPKLFDEPKVLLQRGSLVHTLSRVDGRFPIYRHADGRTAELLLGDRLAIDENGLARPVHRDLRALAREIGFNRARLLEIRQSGLIAELRFGGAWVRSFLAAKGASLSLGCVDAPKEERKRLSVWLTNDARRRSALSRLHAAIDDAVREQLPFDRPREEETADRDGQLRPNWRWAFEHGQSWFSFEEKSYPVFDPRGRPFPPQVCVDFVLDSFERASGTWFLKASDGSTKRVVGKLDFDVHGIKNRRGVLAFEKFAEDNPALFTHSRFQPDERIPFGERSRFFDFLRKNADRFRPGDIVAIQGRKADGLIHQHAILIEDTDPVTGFPDALADQMKRPRRRTWEGIMAEAPLRSLLFHVRPTETILFSLADETEKPIATTTEPGSTRGGG